MERKTSVGAGGDKRAVCCFPSVCEVGRKFPFRSGLSKLCFDSSLRPLRARGLLIATAMEVFLSGYCEEVFCLVLNYHLFGFATSPYSVTVMTI
jgi:hypothetical protein